MKFTVLTLFPDMMKTIFNESIIGRAVKNGLLEINVVNIRDYTTDKHRRVDDSPYGGGFGMVMACQPIVDCYRDVTQGRKVKTLYMSPQGRVFDENAAVELSKEDELVILCGHYEGVDERALEILNVEEYSVGNYVLTGGELPAAIIVDAVGRLVEGVLPDPSCYEDESIFSGLLEYPQYTRPEEYEGKRVPEILLSGHHANIQKWKKEQAIIRTKQKRPDLYEEWLEENKNKGETP